MQRIQGKALLWLARAGTGPAGAAELGRPMLLGIVVGTENHWGRGHLMGGDRSGGTGEDGGVTSGISGKRAAGGMRTMGE